MGMPFDPASPRLAQCTPPATLLSPAVAGAGAGTVVCAWLNETVRAGSASLHFGSAVVITRPGVSQAGRLRAQAVWLL